MRRTRNRLLNSPVGEIEAKIPQFKRMLYSYETGKVKAFYSDEDVMTALDSGLWVKSPKFTNRGEYLARPEVCEFYIDRKCSKGLDCDHEKTPEPEKVLPKPVAGEKEGTVRWKTPGVDVTKTMEPAPRVLDPQVGIVPGAKLGVTTLEPPKITKALSQMNSAELRAEGAIYGFNFDKNDTKIKMTKLIRAEKKK